MNVSENFYDIEIAEESGDSELISEEPLFNVPDPVFVKGSGHMTVFGLSSRFDNEFPQALIGRIAPEEFKATITRINSILRKMVPLNFKWFLVGCLCCCCTLGCSVWPVVCLNRRSKNAIKKALDYENRHLYHKLGLHWKLSKERHNNSTMLGYVLVIQFIPVIPVYRPD